MDKKIAQAAQQAGKDPKAFVDSFIPAYQEAWQTLWDRVHKVYSYNRPFAYYGCQHFVQFLMDKGDIYKASYSGWYCTPCETFITPKEIQKVKSNHFVFHAVE